MANPFAALFTMLSALQAAKQKVTDVAQRTSRGPEEEGINPRYTDASIADVPMGGVNFGGPGPYFMLHGLGGKKFRPTNALYGHGPDDFRYEMERIYNSPAAREVDDHWAASGIPIDRTPIVSYNAWRDALEKLIPVEERLQLPKDIKVQMQMDRPDRLIQNQSRVDAVVNAKEPEIKEVVSEGLAHFNPYSYPRYKSGDIAPVSNERWDSLMDPLERNYLYGFGKPIRDIK